MNGSKIRAAMYKTLTPILFTLLSATVGCGMAWAEKADKSKPMNAEADALRYDDLKQTSVFTGNVVITKGTIVLRAARIDVRQTPDGYQMGTAVAASGKTAFFRQKREGVDEWIEGEAETIEYDGKADSVKFVKRAVMRRYKGAALNDETTGNQIVYDNTTDVFTVEGGAPASPGAPAGRVRVMLTPKDNAAAAPAATSSSPALRSTTNLGGNGK
jgi:lipopolysaccharide export system protein LptA